MRSAVPVGGGRSPLAFGGMKNIQVIDGAESCVYDVFAATDDEFSLIFPGSQDVAFIDEVCSRVEDTTLDQALNRIWARRVLKRDA